MQTAITEATVLQVNILITMVKKACNAIAYTGLLNEK